jgi:4-diphosphocytidyl-2-C-methyl-D-erythritol kinase
VLQQLSGTSFGADISIDKQLPSGAGMGGGSSDAATVLLALNRLWELRLPRARLLELAAPLGADVPFFVGGENAFVEGIGERLTPVDWAPRRYAVVKPAESLGTAAIFSHQDLARDTEPATLAGSVALMRTELVPVFGRNDLQPVAQALCPSIAEVAQWLESRFGNSRMTGSGSAVFAAVGAQDATWSEGELPAGWVGRMCRSLPFHPLRDWAD